jgi:hypothetical protein
MCDYSLHNVKSRSAKIGLQVEHRRRKAVTVGHDLF